MPLAHWTESVFQFFIVRRLLQKGCDVRTEWNRIDFVFKEDGKWYPVEIKFYTHGSNIGLNNSEGKRKGGPSKQNEQEFEQAISRLENLCKEPWYQRHECAFKKGYVVLFYADPTGATNSYRERYEKLIHQNTWPTTPIFQSKILSHEDHEEMAATCLLIDISFSAQSSNHTVSISVDCEMRPLTKEQQQEIDRRLAAHQTNPQSAMSWEKVEAVAVKRFHK